MLRACCVLPAALRRNLKLSTLDVLTFLLAVLSIGAERH
jgi:hypothetical protein